MSRVFGFLKRVTPLRIAMFVAFTFASVHFVIESEAFEFGPLSKKGFIHLLDLKALDLKFLSRDQSNLPEPQVVIAAIDERSIEKYGLFPWNRRIIADLVRTLTVGGAKAVGFDIVFGDEDRNSSYVSIKRFVDEYEANLLQPDSKLANQLTSEVQSTDKLWHEARLALSDLEARAKDAKGPARAQLLEAIAKLKRANERGVRTAAKTKTLLGDWSTRSAGFYGMLSREVNSISPDEAFAQAIAGSPQTILGYFAFFYPREVEDLDVEQLAKDIELLDPVRIPAIYEHVMQDLGGAVIEKHEPVEGIDYEALQIRDMIYARTPLARLAKEAKSLGFFNVSPDQDGQLRRAHMLFKHGESLYPSLTLAAAAKYFNADIYPIDGSIKPGLTIDGINLGDARQIPTDQHGRLLVNYYAPPEKYFPTYGISDILDGQVAAEKYKDKVVLVGATAIGTYDIRPTPFSTIPGVYVHASVIQNIVDQRFLERYYGLALMEIIAYLLLGLIMGIVLPRLPVWGGIVAMVGFAVGLYIVDVTFVFPNGTWMLNVLPTLQAFFTFAGIVVHKYLTEGREKRQIRQAFQFYLSKNVVEEVLRDSSKLKLGGERKVCTVLFSDIRGFTTLSETLQPEELVNLLNEYLTPMTNLVFKHDGTLDKYMGDAIMAIFGAPINYPDHAKRACFTALEMMEELGRLKANWLAQGLKTTIDIGIGLNTGPMAAGNMGSTVRFDYTVMGDMVNLGSRLEGINKEYGTHIIISQYTYEAVKEDIHAREMDLVKVKGKNEPVRIYELLGKGKASGKALEIIQTFEEGLRLYRAQQWDEAIALFERLRTTLNPGDGAAETYIERCELLRANPPGEAWNGVWTMTTK